MQVRAIMEAAVEVKKEKIDVRPLIMIPGVGTVTEMKALRDLVSNEAERIIKASGVKVPLSSRHDDRTAARVYRGAPHRRACRVLLVRHERPHADGIRLLA